MNKHKIALVTGGNSGIGYATAKLLKSKNYDVVIAGRDEKKLILASNKLSIRYFVADLVKADKIQTLAEEFTNTGLDVLVNNAAIFNLFPLTDCSQNLFDDYININLKAPIFLLKALIPALEKKHGAVTNVSSIITQSGLANASIYASTKGALEAFTRNIALELAPKNIRVNTISPGAVDSPLLDKLGLSPSEKDSMMESFSNTIPLQRYAKTDEIAHAIVSQLESTYTTGANWTIDGGVSS